MDHLDEVIGEKITKILMILMINWVVIEMSHFWGNPSDEMVNELGEMVNETLSPLLFPYPPSSSDHQIDQIKDNNDDIYDLSHLPFSSLLQSNQPIILTFEQQLDGYEMVMRW